jgi:hypothetical protein
MKNILLNMRILFLAWLLSASPLLAQRWHAAPTMRTDAPLVLGVSTYFKGLNGGAKVSLLAPVSEKTFSRLRSNGKTRVHIRLHTLEVFMAASHHNRFHTQVVAGGGYLFRRTFTRGFFIEAVTGLGLSRTFVDGITYTPDAAGNLQLQSLNGHWYLTPSVAGGMGYDFRLAKRSLPLTLGGRFNLTALFPYQASLLPVPVVELGFTRRIGTAGPWKMKTAAFSR